MKIARNKFLTHNGGMGEVLKIALPLVLASSAHAINLLSDRIMLDYYSDTAVAGSMSGGLTSFTLSCFFLGIINYTGTFVAQYSGAGASRRVGAAVWQGIILALIGGVILMTGYLWGGHLFAAIGHDPAVVAEESRYFRVLALGGIIVLLFPAFCAFWGGRGKTGMIMAANFLITSLNIPFNYALIFGHWGFPELGIAGAAWGTNLSALAGCLMLGGFFLLPESSRRHFRTCGKIFDWELFKRLIRFGMPNGTQFALDLASFNIFILVLGRYGMVMQAAASIAFGLNSLALTPMLGIGQTVGILVGQSIGARDITHAKRSVASARNLVLIYLVCMASVFVVFPELALWGFSNRNPEVTATAKTILKVIAGYMVFDGLFIVYSNAIRAAGDTFYSMIAGTTMALGMQAAPAFILGYFRITVWAIWICDVVYIITAGTVFYLRYHAGKWTKMKVIEDAAFQDKRGKSGKEIDSPLTGIIS